MTRAWSWFFSLLAIVTLTGMVALFAWQSLPVWQHEGWSYLSGTRWYFRQQHFGAWPMIYGSLAVSLIALVLAAPLGLGAAIFAAEYLPRRPRLLVKIVIELLAGVPSVVYGLLGILLLRDWIYQLTARFDPLSGDTLLTAGVLLAVMILPTIVTFSDDALRSVPAAQRQAARALGLTRAETILHIALPQARRGLLAAVLLAWGRALGETIAVYLVVGRQDNNAPAHLFALQPLLESGQTLTSKLAAETSLAYGDPLHWAAIVGLGLLLLALTGLLTALGFALGRKAHA